MVTEKEAQDLVNSIYKLFDLISEQMEEDKNRALDKIDKVRMKAEKLASHAESR